MLRKAVGKGAYEMARVSKKTRLAGYIAKP